MPTLLQLDAIHTFIGQFHILEGVSLDVPQGSITALLGRNGAGKTTTLKSIMGLTPPHSGRVLFDGAEMRGRRPFDIAALGIGYVPEYRAIFRDLTVEENLKIAERKKGDLNRRAEMIFTLFPDLKRLIKLPGGQLSGGQQQMLAVARALVPDNRLLLIDEPSEGLAPVIIEQMMESIRSLSSHVTVLLVEHNMDIVMNVSDAITVMHHGQVLAEGTPAQISANEQVQKAYLGELYNQ